MARCGGPGKRKPLISTLPVLMYTSAEIKNKSKCIQCGRNAKVDRFDVFQYWPFSSIVFSSIGRLLMYAITDLSFILDETFSVAGIMAINTLIWQSYNYLNLKKMDFTYFINYINLRRMKIYPQGVHFS